MTADKYVAFPHNLDNQAGYFIIVCYTGNPAFMTSFKEV